MALQGSNPMAALKSKVTLKFSAQSLPDLDRDSKTDPMLVLFQQHKGMKQMIGRTEVIPNTLDPEWVAMIDVDYYFEQAQNMIVEVYDIDDPNRLNDLKS